MNYPAAKLLARLPGLEDFSDAQMARLSECVTIRTYDANEPLFSQGEEARLIYITLTGTIRLFHYRDHEKQTIVSLMPTGEFFGLDALLPETRQPFGCEAFETSLVGTLKPQDFVEIMLAASYQDFIRWYRVALFPARQSYIHCVRGIGLDLRRRLALELLNLAHRFGSNDPRGTVLTISISHEGLASLVGASRQQVTQHLNDFDREGLISRNGRRIIVNTGALQRVADGIS